MPFQPLNELFTYNDWANDEILKVAKPLNETQLDQSFDMGRGSLRRTILHIYTAEMVWLSRWQQRGITPWPDEEERLSVATLSERFAVTRREREAFRCKLTPADLEKVQPYRDSKGTMYRASLGQMILQMFTHSTHHRAQAVNMLRRVNAGTVEVDFMYHVRAAAE